MRPAVPDVDAARELLDTVEPTCQVPDLDVGGECGRRADWIAWFVHRATGQDTRRFLQCDLHKRGMERHLEWCCDCNQYRFVATPLRGGRDGD